MMKITDKRQPLFVVKVPNSITKKAIPELELGKDQRFKSSKDLMADLNRDELEDQEDLKLADKAMREMRRGGVKAIPIDQVMKNINLAAAKQTPSSDIFKKSMDPPKSRKY
jgi:hypothetical protein